MVEEQLHCCLLRGFVAQLIYWLRRFLTARFNHDRLHRTVPSAYGMSFFDSTVRLRARSPRALGLTSCHANLNSRPQTTSSERSFGVSVQKDCKRAKGISTSMPRWACRGLAQAKSPTVQNRRSRRTGPRHLPCLSEQHRGNLRVEAAARGWDDTEVSCKLSWAACGFRLCWEDTQNRRP